MASSEGAKRRPRARAVLRGAAAADRIWMVSDRESDERDSTGAWTRTRTNQLQRLAGCQLPNAGLSGQIATSSAAAT